MAPLRMMVMFGARPYLSQPQAVARYVADQLGKVGLELDHEVGAAGDGVPSSFGS